jgi:hypothetical protein
MSVHAGETLVTAASLYVQNTKFGGVSPQRGSERIRFEMRWLRGIWKFVGLTVFGCGGSLKFNRDILHHEWCKMSMMIGELVNGLEGRVDEVGNR